MTQRTPQPYEEPAGHDAHDAREGREGPGASRPRRSRARTLAALGVAAWALLELWLLITLSSAIGGFGVFLVLLAGLVAGAVVVKQAGRRAWRALAEQLQQGTAPGAAASGPEPGRRSGSGNGLTMLAGLLLMVPGLVTDAAGLLLLLPPVRGLVRRRTRRFFAESPAVRDLGQAYTQARIRRPDGKVVPGEVIREDGEEHEPGPGPQP